MASVPFAMENLPVPKTSDFLRVCGTKLLLPGPRQVKPVPGNKQILCGRSMTIEYGHALVQGYCPVKPQPTDLQIHIGCGETQAEVKRTRVTMSLKGNDRCYCTQVLESVRSQGGFHKFHTRRGSTASAGSWLKCLWSLKVADMSENMPTVTGTRN